MRYYKLIENNDTFLGVITENELRKYQKKNNILLVSNSDSAQFARFNENLYRDPAWMKNIDDVPYDNDTYKSVDIININEAEYNALISAIEIGEQIKIEEEIQVVDETIEDEIFETEDVTIDYIKDMKIHEMSIICNKTITDGFNISLSDGNNYHFSLTLEDQMNLLNISNLMDKSDEKIIYHADGERCRYFSKEDMSAIIEKAHIFKTYHTTYFNGLKAYIYSLNDYETINNITYGIELPNKYTHVFLTTHKVM